MPSYSIRLGCRSDIDDLMDMWISLQKHVEKANPHMWRLSKEGHPQLRKRMLSWISSKETRVVLSVSETGEAIGTAVGTVDHHKEYLPSDTGTIMHLFVKREYRRKGIGRKLVASLCEFFKEYGIDDISVRYVVGNIEAEGFWKNLGFTPRIETSGTKRKSLLRNLSMSAEHKGPLNEDS